MKIPNTSDTHAMKSMKLLGKAALISSLLFTATQQAKADGQGWDHNFFWSLWHSGGSASISFSGANQYAGNFAISFSGVGDVTGGKGWNPGGYRTVNYNAGSLSGYNAVSVYGWTTSPLVEYYICEFGSVASGTQVGSFSSDGHNYNVWHHQQMSQPSIIGTATFWQNIDQWGGSSTGANHAVNTGNHFNWWNSHNMAIGTFNYMILSVEAWGGRSGYGNVTVW